jgi:hypothetical protein
VQAAHSIRNGAKTERIGNPMGKQRGAALPALANCPIAAGVDASHPQPTSLRPRCHVNLGPEAFCKRMATANVATATATISAPVAPYFARRPHKVFRTTLANTFNHSSPFTKGDTHDLGRFLLREPAHKIMGVIKKKAAPRYRFPQHPEYSTFWAAGQAAPTPTLSAPPMPVK